MSLAQMSRSQSAPNIFAYSCSENLFLHFVLDSGISKLFDKDDFLLARIASLVLSFSQRGNSTYVNGLNET